MHLTRTTAAEAAADYSDKVQALDFNLIGCTVTDLAKLASFLLLLLLGLSPSFVFRVQWMETKV